MSEQLWNVRGFGLRGGGFTKVVDLPENYEWSNFFMVGPSADWCQDTLLEQDGGPWGSHYKIETVPAQFSEMGDADVRILKVLAEGQSGVAEGCSAESLPYWTWAQRTVDAWEAWRASQAVAK